MSRGGAGNFGRRAMFSAGFLTAYIAAACFGVAVLGIVGLDDAGWWQVWFFSATALIGFAIWRLVPWPDKIARFTSFGACMLIAWVLNRIVWILDFLLAGERFSTWPVYPGNAAWNVLEAEVITVTGTVFTLLVLHLMGGSTPSFAAVSRDLSKAAPRRLVSLIYVLSLILLAAERSGVIPDALRQFVGWSRLAGLSSIILLGLTSQDRFGTLLGRVILMSMPFVFASLQDAMKESIVQSLIPIAIFLFFHVRRNSGRALLLVGVVLVLSVTTALTHFTRMNLRLNNDFSYGLVADFASAVSSEGLLDVGLLGADDLLRRANVGNYRGFAVAIAENEGFKPGLVFGPAVYSMIPRAIWPDKPANMQGEEYNYLIFGRGGSSMSSGLFSGAYLGGGWPGVIAVAILLGLGVAGSGWAAMRYGGSVLFALFSFSLIPIALRIDEGWVGSSLVAVPSGLLYVGVIYAAASFFERALPRSRRRASGILRRAEVGSLYGGSRGV